VIIRPLLLAMGVPASLRTDQSKKLPPGHPAGDPKRFHHRRQRHVREGRQDEDRDPAGGAVHLYLSMSDSA
jgi:hypothetical protein